MIVWWKIGAVWSVTVAAFAAMLLPVHIQTVTVTFPSGMSIAEIQRQSEINLALTYTAGAAVLFVGLGIPIWLTHRIIRRHQIQN